MKIFATHHVLIQTRSCFPGMPMGFQHLSSKKATDRCLQMMRIAARSNAGFGGPDYSRTYDKTSR